MTDRTDPYTALRAASDEFTGRGAGCACGDRADTTLVHGPTACLAASTSSAWTVPGVTAVTRDDLEPRRASCACGAVELGETGEPLHDPGAYIAAGRYQHAAAACLEQLLADPAEVFAKLLRELGAAEVLVRLSTGDERRRAALDGLALARDVLADVAEALA